MAPCAISRLTKPWRRSYGRVSWTPAAVAASRNLCLRQFRARSAFQGEPSGEGKTRSVGALHAVAFRHAAKSSASELRSRTVRVLAVLVGFSCPNATERSTRSVRSPTSCQRRPSASPGTRLSGRGLGGYGQTSGGVPKGEPTSVPKRVLLSNFEAEAAPVGFRRGAGACSTDAVQLTLAPDAVLFVRSSERLELQAEQTRVRAQMQHSRGEPR